MKTVLSALLFLLPATLALAGSGTNSPPPPAPAEAELVILIHGLARSAASMKPLEKELRSLGYRVINFDYPSTEFSIEDLTHDHLAPLLATEAIRSAPRVHFVTHSMGGILLRQQFAQGQPENLGRVVMLAPPNQGSEVVDTIGHWALFGAINGPAGRELGTGEEGISARLPAVNFPLGIIAGDRSINWINSGMIDGPDDGKVSIQSSHVEGESDHLIVHATHPLIMSNKEVLHQVPIFLRQGKFEPDPPCS